MGERSLRDELRAGEIKLGMSCAGASPAAVEVAGLTGCDFVWLEIEHGGSDMMHLEHLCRAAELHGVLSLIRVADGSRTSVLRALEIGGRIVVVPQIHTAEQAAEVVEHGKFAPIGNRGMNLGSRGMRYGTMGSAREAMAAANDMTCLLPQVESAQAVESAEAILATEGLDGVLIGPADLAASMGRPGECDEEVMAAMEHVIVLANRHEKVVATTCPTDEYVRRAKAAGVHMLNCGGDWGLMRTALEARLAEVRMNDERGTRADERTATAVADESAPTGDGDRAAYAGLGGVGTPCEN